MQSKATDTRPQWHIPGLTSSAQHLSPFTSFTSAKEKLTTRWGCAKSKLRCSAIWLCQSAHSFTDQRSQTSKQSLTQGMYELHLVITQWLGQSLWSLSISYPWFYKCFYLQEKQLIYLFWKRLPHQWVGSITVIPAGNQGVQPFRRLGWEAQQCGFMQHQLSAGR